MCAGKNTCNQKSIIEQVEGKYSRFVPAFPVYKQ